MRTILATLTIVGGLAAAMVHSGCGYAPTGEDRRIGPRLGADQADLKMTLKDAAAKDAEYRRLRKELLKSTAGP